MVRTAISSDAVPSYDLIKMYCSSRRGVTLLLKTPRLVHITPLNMRQ